MTTATNTLTEQQAKEALASLWWLPLIRGILLIIFGILMFNQPGATLLSLLWFMGIYWIVDGIFSIIEGIRGHTEKSRFWMFVGGIFSILGGLFIIGNPLVAGLASSTLLISLIGIAIIINGLMMIFAGRRRHGSREWTLGGLVMGILYVIFGIFVLGHLFATMGILFWLFSIWAIVSGVIAIIMALQLRGLATSE